VSDPFVIIYSGVARIGIIWKLIFDEGSRDLFAVAVVNGMHNSMSRHVFILG
jgi:hypothetical protein